MRGKLRPAKTLLMRGYGFNEARALCAGSCWSDDEDVEYAQTASMRPAHCAREVGPDILPAFLAVGASMRPAHCAREVRLRDLKTAPATTASMRPAHCAREVAARVAATLSAYVLQ